MTRSNVIAAGAARWLGSPPGEVRVRNLGKVVAVGFWVVGLPLLGLGVFGIYATWACGSGYWCGLGNAIALLLLPPGLMLSVAGVGIWGRRRWGLWLGVLTSLIGTAFGVWHLIDERSGNLVIGFVLVDVFAVMLVALVASYAQPRGQRPG